MRKRMDKKTRCFGDTEIYIGYHDNEWGRPVHDDNRLFEMLILEWRRQVFRGSLSWDHCLEKIDSNILH